MIRLAVLGSGARADAIAASIALGSGLALAERPDTADALVIGGATAPESLALAREALAAGKPTLCPTLPADRATLDALIALAERHGAPLGLPNELRYLPATLALRETLARGEAGPLLSAFLSWRVIRGEAIGGTGDPLATLGPAALDLLAWLLPAPIARAQLAAAPLFGPAQDTALLTLRDESGLVRTVELIAGLPPAPGFADELLLEVFGETAALRAEPFNQAIAIASATAHRRQDWSTSALDPLLAAFAAALQSGDPLPGPPAALRPTLTLLEELRAAATAQRHSLSPQTGI